ncbi:MAG: hypothetical protein FWG34_07495 [Oscillospiraceae bacterium]|nr:hypothetical protein [Oscillospiraceae bacterium]
MKIFKKAIILLLSIALPAMFFSCAPDSQGDPKDSKQETASGNNGEDAAKQQTDSEKLHPNLPDVRYKGDTFSFLVYEWNADGYWGSYEIYAEEETGDAINDAVYRRNRAVEERLDINLKEVRNADVVGLAQKSIKADDPEYDCIMPRIGSAANMAGNGYLLSYDQLPHINRQAPWWDQNAAEMLSIGGQLFFCVGDLSVMDKDSMFIVMFNKTVAKNSGIENMYDLVKNNKWTMDKFHSIMKEASRDLNGDGAIGFEDLAGLASSDFAINVLYYNSGESVSRKDPDDYPYFTMNTERGVLAAEKAFEIVTDKSASVLAGEMKGIANPWTDGINRMFQEDRALFLLAQITFIHQTRTMESDFGILPSPKLDESQDKYYSVINPVVSNCVAVPITAQDKEKTSIILEALTAESKYTLIPAYYDITITNKMMRDEESAEMLDIILSSRTFDLGFIFNWGDLGNVPLSLYPKGGNFVSTYEKREPKAVSEMEKTIEAFKALN